MLHRRDCVANAWVASIVQVPPFGNRTSARLEVPASARPCGQAVSAAIVSDPESTTSAALLSDDVRMSSARRVSVSTRTPIRRADPVGGTDDAPPTLGKDGLVSYRTIAMTPPGVARLSDRKKL